METNAPAYVAYTLDAAVAIASTLTVVPVIAIVDKAIFSNASGKEPLGSSIRNSLAEVIQRPGVFFRSPAFRWIWAVYGGTYITANWISLYCERSHTPIDLPKFVGTSASNVTLSVLKDRAFSRYYGVVAPKPVPLTSLSMFATRDSLSILASFTLPGTVAAVLQSRYGMSADYAYMLAQVTTPLAAQIFSTPLHLLGMDVYNRPTLPFRSRFDFVIKEYAKTTIARMARVLPAFGAGGVLNKYLRQEVHAVQARIYGVPPGACPSPKGCPEKWETD